LKRAVLDTSVIIKWFHEENEEDVEAALILRKAYADGFLTVSVPDLLFYEFANTLRYKNNLSFEDGIEKLRDLSSIGLEVHSMDWELTEAMFRLSLDRGLTIYDATYLALADRLSATLVTADRSVFQKAKGGHSVMLLSELTNG